MKIKANFAKVFDEFKHYGLVKRKGKWHHRNYKRSIPYGLSLMQACFTVAYKNNYILGGYHIDFL